ncbi:Na+/H+ antiporter subunit E [Catenovulum adriaticum]|uniref:Na+/H+ antiporter subunit E n=1 Tax=Catenovulum adriaticum TaxID=2984846 RepID=A0ABY7AW60_9ALTE|nr:Na+/H+ antiporter subunit E [Catenovulum sp. TS8]WAJ72446.1 Na+/H+ antiporter subunit E [Catenovulum sp. TS8]
MNRATALKIFPAPATSLLLLLVWLLLNNSVSVGHLILGSVLAFVIPLLTEPFRDEHAFVNKPLLALKQLLTVLYDIITANVQVAILILGPNKKLRPAFVKVPLDMTEALPITLLASTVSLTPGTVSAEVYPVTENHIDNANLEQKYLLIHVLDLKNENELIQEIKQRYEAPLKEIFQC